MQPIAKISQHNPTAITLVTLLTLGLSLIVLPCSRVLAEGDDFNDNSKDTAKWGDDDIVGNGVLTETNQRLEYTCSTGTAEDEIRNLFHLSTSCSAGRRHTVKNR